MIILDGFRASGALWDYSWKKGGPTLGMDVLVLELATNARYCSIDDLPQGTTEIPWNRLQAILDLEAVIVHDYFKQSSVDWAP